ncbi:Protein of unknown function DUF847 [uncultured Caudovirales phage]|uniref:Uncharacterized protein n=1 Tax=uncultured Caudovirales phage TaxID=2100421 RepID=A0A6J5LES0_9CAUD|nr:Protein of unknown function DUF847 [uncultured Caudovirales phage]
MTPYELAKAFTLKAEGGLTRDNGGLTMNGVTQAVYDTYRKLHSLPAQTVAKISPAEVDDIMHAEYWNPAHCDSLPTKVAVAMFDWAYNHGVGGAVMTLQRALGLSTDGVFGTNTATAVHAADANLLLSKFLDARRAWYRQAVDANPSKYQPYLAGWLNRVNNLQDYLNEV